MLSQPKGYDMVIIGMEGMTVEGDIFTAAADKKLPEICWNCKSKVTPLDTKQDKQKVARCSYCPAVYWFDADGSLNVGNTIPAEFVEAIKKLAVNPTPFKDST